MCVNCTYSEIPAFYSIYRTRNMITEEEIKVNLLYFIVQQYFLTLYLSFFTL